jgi:hypothetical protein
VLRGAAPAIPLPRHLAAFRPALAPAAKREEDPADVLRRLRDMLRRRSKEFSDPSLRPTDKSFSDPSLRPGQESPAAGEKDKPRPPVSPE